MKRSARYWLNLAIFAVVMLALIPFLVLTGISYLYTGMFTRTPCIRASRTPADIGITRLVVKVVSAVSSGVPQAVILPTVHYPLTTRVMYNSPNSNPRAR